MGWLGCDCDGKAMVLKTGGKALNRKEVAEKRFVSLMAEHTCQVGGCGGSLRAWHSILAHSIFETKMLMRG